MHTHTHMHILHSRPQGRPRLGAQGMVWDSIGLNFPTKIGIQSFQSYNGPPHEGEVDRLTPQGYNEIPDILNVSGWATEPSKTWPQVHYLTLNSHNKLKNDKARKLFALYPRLSKCKTSLQTWR